MANSSVVCTFLVNYLIKPPAYRFTVFENYTKSLIVEHFKKRYLDDLLEESKYSFWRKIQMRHFWGFANTACREVILDSL